MRADPILHAATANDKASTCYGPWAMGLPLVAHTFDADTEAPNFREFSYVCQLRPRVGTWKIIANVAVPSACHPMVVDGQSRRRSNFLPL